MDKLCDYCETKLKEGDKVIISDFHEWDHMHKECFENWSFGLTEEEIVWCIDN